MIVPAAVEAEIMPGRSSTPSREYPYATLFRHLQDKLRKSDIDVTPVPLFGRGEAEAIALAERFGAILLINEKRGAQYARNVGVEVVTVPAVVVLLRSQGVISDRAARRKLVLIAPNPAPEIIE